MTGKFDNHAFDTAPYLGLYQIYGRCHAPLASVRRSIATFLALDGHVFIAPQFNIAYDRELNEGGSTPDFVALDLRNREVVVVEVTKAANMKPLIERVKQRQSRWYSPIRAKMQTVGVIDDSWKLPRFLGFVREANLEIIRSHFTGEADVAFYAIEKATFLWEYWERRMKEGLPR